MKRTVLVCCVLLAFCASDVFAVIRYCDSSKHRIRGTVQTSDGKQHHKIEAAVSMQAVTGEGEHWRPPIARRRACRDASKTAASIIANKDYKELARTLCRSPQATRFGVPVEVLPKLAIADGWHGSENNDHALPIAKGWVQCETKEKKFPKPMFQGKPLDWCLYWKEHGKEQCGQPAAEEFCQNKGYKTAKKVSDSFQIKVPETSLIGTLGQTCSGSNCYTFREITCFE